MLCAHAPRSVVGAAADAPADVATAFGAQECAPAAPAARSQAKPRSGTVDATVVAEEAAALQDARYVAAWAQLLRWPIFLRLWREARARSDATLLHAALEELLRRSPARHAALASHPAAFLRAMNRNMPRDRDGATPEVRALWAHVAGQQHTLHRLQEEAAAAREEAAAARAEAAAAVSTQRALAMHLQNVILALQQERAAPEQRAPDRAAAAHPAACNVTQPAPLQAAAAPGAHVAAAGPPPGAPRFAGVFWDTVGGKWDVRCCEMWLACFPAGQEVVAAHVYDAAMRAAGGTCVNFPRPGSAETQARRLWHATTQSRARAPRSHAAPAHAAAQLRAPLVGATSAAAAAAPAGELHACAPTAEAAAASGPAAAAAASLPDSSAPGASAHGAPANAKGASDAAQPMQAGDESSPLPSLRRPDAAWCSEGAGTAERPLATACVAAVATDELPGSGSGGRRRAVMSCQREHPSKRPRQDAASAGAAAAALARDPRAPLPHARRPAQPEAGGMPAAADTREQGPSQEGPPAAQRVQEEVAARTVAVTAQQGALEVAPHAAEPARAAANEAAVARVCAPAAAGCTQPAPPQATEHGRSATVGPPPGAQRFKGVMWVGDRRQWSAIYVPPGSNAQTFLGRFRIGEEVAAAHAFDAAVRAAGGTCVNFPREGTYETRALFKRGRPKWQMGAASPPAQPARAGLDEASPLPSLRPAARSSDGAAEAPSASASMPSTNGEDHCDGGSGTAPSQRGEAASMQPPEAAAAAEAAPAPGAALAAQPAEAAGLCPPSSRPAGAPFFRGVQWWSTVQKWRVVVATAAAGGGNSSRCVGTFAADAAVEAAHAYDAVVRATGGTEVNFPLPGSAETQAAAAKRVPASGHAGVHRIGRRFEATAWLDGRARYIGMFDSAEEAARVRDRFLRDAGAPLHRPLAAAAEADTPHGPPQQQAAPAEAAP